MTAAAPVATPNDLEAFWMPFTANRSFKKNPRLIARAEGMFYYTPENKPVMDGTAGLWCCNAGHAREPIIQAIQAGFTSVMIDASMLPFEENVALTRKVVDAAHAVGIQVEGELGTIGANDSYGESGAEEIIYTDPADARRFVEETGVDSLAIAIGTSHGLYPADKNPELRHEILKEIKAELGIPLVLHGGSANPDSELARAVQLGINKINISSDIKVSYHNRMREVLGTDERLREPNAIQPEPIKALQATAAQKIELFGADGKAGLYR